MVGEVIRDKSRTSDEDTQTLDADSGNSEIQRGYFKRSQFYGDQSGEDSHAAFSGGAAVGAIFAGAVSLLKTDLVQQRDPQKSFRLTTDEYAEIQKRAISIANYGNIPLDVCEDFLIILCYVDNINDLTTIANGVQIAELADSSLIRQPMLILAIPGLEKIAFMASAVEGLVNMFRKYIQAANSTDNSSESTSNILSTLSSLIGGFGGGAEARLAAATSTDALGNFLSELITGKRIPMTVIAKNPALQAPSYTGKAFFGEAPAALSNVDIEQLFNKKIGCFPKPSNGAGTTSFGFQNMGSFSNSMSLSGLVSKVLFGGLEAVVGSKKAGQVSAIVDQISTLTGSNVDEILDIRRADTAIPMLSALSAVASGTDKSIFSADTFAKGWQLSNSVSNHLQNVDPKFMELVKRFT